MKPSSCLPLLRFHILSSPSNTALNTHSKPLNDSVVRRIRSRLVEHTDRLAIEPHPIPPEAHIRYRRFFLLLISLSSSLCSTRTIKIMITLYKQRHSRRPIPQGPVQWQLSDATGGRRGGGSGPGSRGNGEMEGLRRWEIGGGAEVEIGPVAEERDLGGELRMGGKCSRSVCSVTREVKL